MRLRRPRRRWHILGLFLSCCNTPRGLVAPSHPPLLFRRRVLLNGLLGNRRQRIRTLALQTPVADAVRYRRANPVHQNNPGRQMLRRIGCCRRRSPGTLRHLGGRRPRPRSLLCLLRRLLHRRTCRRKAQQRRQCQFPLPVHHTPNRLNPLHKDRKFSPQAKKQDKKF